MCPIPDSQENIPGIIEIPSVPIVRNNGDPDFLIENVNPGFLLTYGKGLCSRNPGTFF